jgi:hypothetical protein
MSDGDSIQAGHITTAYSTTDLVAEQERKTFGTKAFVGDVIFRVGPTDNATNGLMPDTTLDGVQGAGNQGGSGLIGTGGSMLATNFRASAFLVLAVLPIHFRRSQIRPELVSKASRAARPTESSARRRSIQKRRVRLQFFIFDPHGYCRLRGVRSLQHRRWSRRR